MRQHRRGSESLSAESDPLLRQWAARQLADYDSHQPGTLFAEGVVLDVERAYELQTAVTRLRCARGERTVGYKVGCTSPTIRAQLGIDHRVSGRLYDSEQHVSGIGLSRHQFAALAVEGELAVELSREPRGEDFSAGTLPACVSRVFPVIELHNHVMRGERPSAGELVANNAIHAGFVASDGIAAAQLDEKSLATAELSIFANDRVLEQCSGPALIHTIHSSLHWLAEFSQARGDQLGADDVILTGSIPSLIRIVEDCVVRVDAPPFGSVEAVFST